MRIFIVIFLGLSLLIIGFLYSTPLGEVARNQHQSPARNEQEPAELQNMPHGDAMDDLARVRKHVKTFNSSFLIDPEAAYSQFSKAVKALYGEHPLIDEWLEIHFRITRDKKGTLADFIHLTELRIQLLKDLDAAKYAKQIEIYQISLRSLLAMAKTVDNPETFEMKYEPR